MDGDIPNSTTGNAANGSFASPAAGQAEELSQEEKDLIEQIEKMKEHLDNARRDVQDTDFFKVTETVPELGRLKFKIRKKLRGHMAKVTDIHWSHDSQLLVSASQDGKLIVWDTFTGCKIHMIPLTTAWVIGCCISPTNKFIASGGLDNIVSMFDIGTSDDPQKPCRELDGHNGYIAACRFLESDSQMITASGDKTCGLWDVERSELKSRFYGHENDVNAVAINKTNSNVFVTASSDKSARLWDIRTRNCTQIFEGHEQDVNGVDFFPPNNDYAFVTSSDDGSCRLWDIRGDQSIAVYIDDYITCGSTCVSMSKSGRLLIAGYDDFNCHVWDTLREERVGILTAHDGRISSVAISPNGIGVATGSWDNTCLVWTAKA